MVVALGNSFNTHMIAIVPQLDPVAKAIKIEIVNVRVGSKRKSSEGLVIISEKKRSVKLDKICQF